MTYQNIIDGMLCLYYKLLGENKQWDDIKGLSFDEAYIDSLDRCEGVIYLEDKFDIVLLDSELSKCNIIQDVATLIASKLYIDDYFENEFKK